MMRTLRWGVLKLAGILVVSLGLLSACATQDNSAIIAADTPSAQDAEVEQVASPALPSLDFKWPLSSSTLIAPPVKIQADAIEDCRARGYDTSYMINVGIAGDMAIGTFGCRGAD